MRREGYEFAVYPDPKFVAPGRFEGVVSEPVLKEVVIDVGPQELQQ